MSTGAGRISNRLGKIQRRAERLRETFSRRFVFLLVDSWTAESKASVVSSACTKFQDFEIEHIERMLAFSLSFSQILHRTYDQIQQAQTEFSSKLKTLTGNNLLESFVEQKQTGVERPGETRRSFLVRLDRRFSCFAIRRIRSFSWTIEQSVGPSC